MFISLKLIKDCVDAIKWVKCKKDGKKWNLNRDIVKNTTKKLLSNQRIEPKLKIEVSNNNSLQIHRIHSDLVKLVCNFFQPTSQYTRTNYTISMLGLS